jgi:hypothetical protein
MTTYRRSGSNALNNTKKIVQGAVWFISCLLFDMWMIYKFLE